MARSKNAVYGQNGQKWPFVRKNSAVSDPVLRTNAPKSRFVRKMRFAYGQISKKRHFVRKFE